ncbi:alpha/beta hydrolase [Croceicoccus sediminis]|uniref:alpha/beta hydrolase n=1 Tax=Croceicoccus sediminis TaxID=2571150 RepID=UPI001F107B12|nr:alpha/beta hydrolase [Croceicoccus sediminis]
MVVEKGKFEIERSLVSIVYNDTLATRDVYGFRSAAGNVQLDGFLMRPKGKPSKTLIMYMHPASMVNHLPLPSELVGMGFHVLTAGSRYNRNEAALIMENVVRDYGAYVRHMKEEMGYEKVVVAGWSGGGSLTAFYQAMAENPTVTQTPAGDPVDLSGLIPGDAMIFHAAHLSRAEILRDFIDPSVIDEHNPAIRDHELDLYSPRNPNQPPYSADYLEYFRKSQLARMRRRTALAKETLDLIRTGTTDEIERCMVTHRTLANPLFLDATIDPNDRRINWCFMGDPKTANSSPAGVGRFSNTRAWLSQWSIDDTNAHAEKHAPNISIPMLAIENSADDAIPGTHTTRFFNAYGGKDKTYKLMKGANHYYVGQPQELADALDLIHGWLDERGLVD